MFVDLIDEVNSLTDQEIAREDFETHFSLGVAYREMNLVDDAIKEFQAAIKSLDSTKAPHEAIQCCGMLSTCYLDKGMARSAIRWCQTGLRSPDISAHERLALQYDMGVAYALEGETLRALESFGGVFSVDPSYRDVAQRIDDLKAGHVQHAPPDPP
jgi:lipopolysaccharide biosynthesis regulator YciM